MQDLKEDAFESLPTKSSILDLVDDYTLFCYYMEEDVVINKVILSPIREPGSDKADTLASFVIYQGRNGELRYYDYGKGGKGGDVFDFVGELFNIPILQNVLIKIDRDLELGLYYNNTAEQNPEQIAKRKFLEPKPRLVHDTVDIKDVISHKTFPIAGQEYWKQYWITLETLKEYNVTQVSTVITDRFNLSMKGLAFAYRIGEKFKIYQPGNTEHKFINNFPANYVEGYYQLYVRKPSKPVLFITKSLKDVMVLRELKQDAISPKAENILVPTNILEDLEKQYKHIILLFDDDPAGNKAIAKYKYRSIRVPLEEDVKDISDYIKKYGPTKTKQLLINLLSQNGT